MIERPEGEDRIKGLVDLENYRNSDINLEGWELTATLDNILFVQYIDVSEDGREIKRGNIWLPIDVVNFTWRIGKVIIAGVGCKTIKTGDNIMFGSDKGIKAANINNLNPS